MDPRGFEAKAPQGTLSNYCRNCGLHLSAHPTVWLVAAGSRRVCPNQGGAAALNESPIAPYNAAEAGERTPLDQIQSPYSGSAFVPSPSQVAPFGTQTQIDNGETPRLTKRMGGGKADHLDSNCVADGDPFAGRASVPHRVLPRSSLVGAGIHSTEVEPAPRPTPCARTNQSHLFGASIERVAHDFDQTNPRRPGAGN